MQTVVQLMHSQADPNRRNRKRIGLYKSAKEARAAITELSSLPGFRNPDGFFSLHECIIDHDYVPHGLDTQEPSPTLTDATPSNQNFDKLFLVYNESIESEIYQGDTVVFIGYYSSEDLAKIAIQKLQKLEIFPTEKREFNYFSVFLNQTNWTSGYATVEETMKHFR
jgi:hypothetical protein